MEVKTWVAAALATVFSLALVLSPKEAEGQVPEAKPDSAKTELMATYPNHSRRGAFPNPAMWAELGEWAYAAATFDTVQRGVFLQLNKKIADGVWADAIWQKGTLTVAGSFEIAGWMLLGASASTNGKSEVGAIFIPVHTAGSLAQIGAKYNPADGTYQFGAEIRQLAWKGWALTLSGQAAMDGNGLKDKGAGLQAGNDKWQFSAGAGGKGWKDFSGAARRVFTAKEGKFIGEVRLLPGKEVQAGVTYFLPIKR
ncbi:MAG: hypothetical protein NTX79_01100 [Candidatus Micrarchaeota archaeon]|nr:hypothetical protein [Candidatus Micrarchaeota archaeon]